MAETNTTDYSKLKVVELKDLLKQAGLPVSGKKDDLIARLQQNDTEEEEQQSQAGGTAAGDEQQPVTAVAVQAPLATTTPVAPAPPVLESAPPAVALAPPTTSNGSHARDDDNDAEPASKRVKVDTSASDDVQAIVQKPQAATVLQDAADDDDDDDDGPEEYAFEPEDPDQLNRPTDMYLDTINRQALDFDFERLCSVTLSQNNIYACLTDGKYFQGRGKTSPAYAHSIAEDHHVYINLSTQKVYVLPDGYEVNDPSLDDIKYLLYPTFTPALLQRIDEATQPHYDLAQRPYYPGFVGLNNIKANSYMNAILHALVHVVPLRNYFILDPHPASSDATELVKRFSMFCRKVWNPRAFKGQVSPHELLQECANASGKRFKITEVGDPLEFLSWLLNQLHKDLGGNKKAKSSIIYSAFQGEVRVDDQQVLTTGQYGTKPRFDLDRDIKTTRSPFLFLAIDLPPPPLFQDQNKERIVPQVPISAVLAKYDGRSTQESGGVIRRFKVTRLPPFLILHVKRFTKNNFVEEKNPTIVNFPLRGVDMNEYVEPAATVPTYYDLVSNITHSSAAGTARSETQWKAQVHLRPSRASASASVGVDAGNNEGGGGGGAVGGDDDDKEKWFQIQDLIVEEINKGMISLGESYIQIWERRGAGSEDLMVETPKAKPKVLGGDGAASNGKVKPGKASS